MRLPLRAGMALLLVPILALPLTLCGCTPAAVAARPAAAAVYQFVQDYLLGKLVDLFWPQGSSGKEPADSERLRQEVEYLCRRLGDVSFDLHLLSREFRDSVQKDPSRENFEKAAQFLLGRVADLERNKPDHATPAAVEQAKSDLQAHLLALQTEMADHERRLRKLEQHLQDQDLDPHLRTEGLSVRLANTTEVPVTVSIRYRHEDEWLTLQQRLDPMEERANASFTTDYRRICLRVTTADGEELTRVEEGCEHPVNGTSQRMKQFVLPASTSSYLLGVD